MRKTGKFGCDFGILPTVTALNGVLRCMDGMTDGNAVERCESAFNTFTRAGGLRIEVKSAKLMWGKRRRTWMLQWKCVKPALFDVLILVAFCPDRIRVWAIDNRGRRLIGDGGWFSPESVDKKGGIFIDVRAPLNTPCPNDALRMLSTKIACRVRRGKRVCRIERDALMHGDVSASGLLIGGAPLADVLF